MFYTENANPVMELDEMLTVLVTDGYCHSQIDCQTFIKNNLKMTPYEELQLENLALKNRGKQAEVVKVEEVKVVFEEPSV